MAVEEKNLRLEELFKFLDGLEIKEVRMHIFTTEDMKVVVDPEGKASIHKEDRSRTAMFIIDLPLING